VHFALSIFPGDDKPEGRRLSADWTTCARALLDDVHPREVPKRALPFWSPTVFHGDHRSRANVEAAYAVGFDVDIAPVPDAETLRTIFAGQAALFHCSSSSTLAAPRWRLILPVSRPMSGDEYDRVWRAVAALLPFAVGNEAKDPSRGWYWPRVPTEGDFVGDVLEGTPLDVDAILASAPPAAPAPREAAPDARRTAMAAALGAAWPPKGEGRNHAQLALAGALRHEGFTEAEAVEFLCKVCRDAGDEDRQKRETTVRLTFGKPEGYALIGWTRLKSFVDPVVVDAARSALGRNAEFDERTMRRLAGAAANDTGTKPRAFEVVSAADLAKPVPPVPYVVRHFGIAPGRPTLFAGYGGTGKTILIQWLALLMAAGLTRCWGLPIAVGTVLHIDFEMTLDPIRRRYQRLAFACGVELAKCALELISMPEIYLSDQDAEQALVRVCAGKILVIVDNLAAATATALSKENESNIRKYLDILTRVSAKTGCTFVVLVHERKAGKDDPGGLQRVRGSSAITDAAGSVVSISVAEGDGVITVSQTKTSVRRRGEDLTLKIEDVNYEPGVLPFSPPGEDEDPPGLRVVSLAERPASEESKAVQAQILAELAKGAVENKHLLHKRIFKKHGTCNAEIDALLVRREIAFIKGTGYVVDNPEQRAQRVGAAAATCRTLTQLAKAACVDESVLNELAASGRLHRSGGGFILLPVSAVPSPRPVPRPAL
jgi:hypothetical protein